MNNNRPQKTDRWLWIMLGVSIVLIADYTRLILTTDTAFYRIFVLIGWVIIFLINLIRIILAHRQHRVKE